MWEENAPENTALRAPVKGEPLSLTFATMPHPNRRRFLKLLAAAGTVAAEWPDRWPLAAQVTATVTPFFAQPDGQRCLVRFFVSGVEAPAGRLRAFDRARRQLGTAGVVPFGDGRLYGELWLPAGLLDRIQTELAAPGLAGPLVTWHALTPPPRWTVHWITLLEPETLRGALDALEPIPRAATTAALQQVGAMVNPLPHRVPAFIGDVPFLRFAQPALVVAARAGLSAGSVAAASAADLELPTLPAALVGTGVTSLVLLDAAASGLYWWQGPDGSRVLVAALPAGADAVSLEFAEGGDRMMRAVERFLSGENAPPTPVALVVGRGTQVARAAEAVSEWNARFAYPRVIVGGADGFLREAVRSGGDRISSWVTASPTPPEPATLADVTAQAEARAAERVRRAEAMISCLNPGGLAAVANQLAFAVPGTLVFNPTSYPRTDVVRTAIGLERVVTDIPPLGYAYFPLRTEDREGWEQMEDVGPPLTIESPAFRVALDPGSGAIRSLISRADGVDWAREAQGLNGIAGAGLERATRETLSGVGTRIIAERRSQAGGSVRSVVTIYQRLPWVDVVNVAEAPGGGPMEYRFAFAVDGTGVEWEIPGGRARGTPPCECAHLRWLRVTGNGRAALLAALQAATARMDGDGVLTSYGPAGESRYRIGVHPTGAFSHPDDPWRFGWGVEPCVTAPVPGTGGATLPSFGSLLVIDQAGIALVGMQPAADGNGVIVYLQELNGHAGVATLGGGILGFRDARRVDLVERDLGPPAMVMRNGVGVMLAAHGVAALRLLDVTLGRP